MKKALSFGVVLLFVSTLALPVLAAGSGKEVKLAGWITDEWCGAKNANAEGAGCARACAKQGAELVLFSDGKAYHLSDQKVAFEHVGHKVVVTGVIKDEDTIEVGSIEPVKDGDA